MTDHLSRLELLRYVDGELSKPDMAAAAEHIQSCWSCRSALEHLETDICEIFEASERVFLPELPSPPKPWPGLESAFARSEEAGKASVLRRITELVSVPWRFPVRFATAATVAMLVVALFVLQVRPLSAEEIIQQVTAADGNRLRVSSNELVVQRVRISKRTPGSSEAVNASVAGWQAGTTTYWQSEQPSLASELLNRYKAAGITAALPLSSVALQGWMRMIGNKPTASRERGGMVTLQAASENGAAGIREVVFQVRSKDWHLNQVRLTFVDATYDIAEDDFSVIDKSEVPATVLASLEVPALHASPKPTASAPRIANPDEIEMGVRYALHRIGADLGEAIEVSRPASGEVLVNAWGLSAARRSQLAALLGDRQGVRLEFQPPAAVTPTGEHTTTLASQTSVSKVQDERLIEYFGSPEAEEDYTRQVLRTSTTILSHLYALNALAVRWPARRDSMSATARAELAAIISDHARQLRLQTDQLRSQLDPLLIRFGQTAIPSTEPASSGVAWQNSSHSGLEDGRRLDHTLRSLLTTSDDPASVEVALPRLQQHLQALDRAANELLLGSRR